MNFLYYDVVSIILEYVTSIHFDVVRSFGAKGVTDHKFKFPDNFCFYRDEIFIVDTVDTVAHIQVFEQSTGRFLRKWNTIVVDHYRALCSIAVDEQEVFFTDSISDHIQVFDLEKGHLLRRWDGSDGGMKLNGPIALYIFNREIFVSDYWNHRVVVFTKEGRAKTSIQTLPKTQNMYPWGMTSDQGELFIADTAHDRIQVFAMQPDNSYTYNRQYGSGNKSDRKSELSNPVGCVTHGCDLIVCDRGKGLCVFNRETMEVERLFSHTFTCRSVLAINGNNELYVCDSRNGCLLVFQ